MYRILGGDGKEYGPVSAETLRQWMAEGRANAQTQVLPEGAGRWVALGALPEFSGAGVPASVAAAGPQPSPGRAAASANVPNYLVQSILVTLCCCIPFGIPAIVYAAQVNSKLAFGDVAGAQDASNKAKMWCWIAFGVGIVVNLIAGVIQILAITARTASHMH